MSRKAYELTGLENPNSVSQLKAWLEDRGIEVESLGKKDVAAMIAELDKNSVDQEALDMLRLRLQMAKSSVQKVPGGGAVCLCRWQSQRAFPVLRCEPHRPLFRPTYPVTEISPQEPHLHAG